MPFDQQSSLDNINSRSTEYSARVREQIENNIEQIANELLPETEYLRHETNPDTGEQIVVVDLDRLKNSFAVDEQGHRFRYKGLRIATKKIAKAIYERHKGLECISTTQSENGDFTTKPLFYYPESVKAASHRLTVRNSDYHFALWDLLHENAINLREETQETQDGQSISMIEAKTGAVLFRDLDAQRDDETGQLYVRNPAYDPHDKKSQKIVPLSRDILRDNGLRPLVEVTGKKSRSVRAGLMEHCPNLLASKALRLEDFREITLSGEGEKTHNFLPKEVSTTGYVMIHGVNHYVGRRFSGAQVMPFDGESALLIERVGGKDIIHGMFALIDKNEIADTTYVNQKSGNVVPRANANKTRLQEIKYNQYIDNSRSSVVNEQQQREIETRVKLAIDQLVAVANQAEGIVLEEVGEAEPEFVLAVRKSILGNAKQLLLSISKASDPQTIERILDNHAIEAKSFVSILQQVGVEKMLRQPLDRISAVELTELDREQMRRLIRENYEREYPGEANQEFRETVIKSFESALKRVATDLYILRDGEEIVSYNRFDSRVNNKTGQRQLYFGSFNADPKYRGVGGFMLERTIREKLEECEAIQAHCDPQSDISKKYIEDGFIATQTETLAGKFSFEIWRSKDSSEILQTKKMSQEELVAIAGDTMDRDTDYWVREVEPNDPFHELDEGLGFLMTRYFTYQGKTYAAFEINSTLSRQFVPIVEE